MSEGYGVTDLFMWRWWDGVLIVGVGGWEARFVGEAAETGGALLIKLRDLEKGRGRDAVIGLTNLYLTGLIGGVLAGEKDSASLRLVGKYDG